MKKLSIFILMAFFAVNVMAQNSKEERKAAKKAQKEEQKRVALEKSAVLKEFINQKKFVLEAHTLYDRQGASYNISSTLNFVGFDGVNSTIQLGFDQIVGWNGVGGVTVDGRISKMEIKGKDNEPNFSVNVIVQNRGAGQVTMIFRVSSDGNARVDMSGSFGDKISFQGYIVSLDETRVYKGTPVF